MPEVRIREAESGDWPELWPMLQEAFAAGDSYAVPLDMTEDQTREFWMDSPNRAYLAEDDSGVLGTYFLKTNLQGPGSHVCNAGFVVRSNSRGRGVGRMLGEHSLKEAARLGYEGMQFNCVVSTNVLAIELWNHLGFQIVGTVPDAFHHRERGKVDIHIMFRKLV